MIIQCFSFEYLLDQELKGIQKLNPKKPVLTNDVPDIIHHNFNNSLSNSLFPTALKYVDITPVFKKNDKTVKKNYGPVSILPTLSRVYERWIYDQLYPYFDKTSKFQRGFCKDLSVKQFLISMTEKWKKSLDSGGYSGVSLTELCNTLFDFIDDHKFLLDKFYAYVVDKNSLYFIHSYLSKIKQRAKKKTFYKKFTVIYYGVPQGSIGSLIFYMYICNVSYDTDR